MSAPTPVGEWFDPAAYQPTIASDCRDIDALQARVAELERERDELRRKRDEQLVLRVAAEDAARTAQKRLADATAAIANLKSRLAVFDRRGW
ncbi:hypothetical protein MSP7336_01841 [Mycobacterium shimoidei]|uniref:Uncharacterized protein n=1 Tax=Mycobacterium shimoidei TaxID=29313 RepID=A0A375YXP3_MYCSH|nr:hypothetical protein [Mycobacterium shimoidei]SRX93602.1 hypothetical protein MSP7336_01841 [Mycobacterium shimoidei]